MVASGITRKRLPPNNEIICTLNQPDISEIAQRINNTRSAAAVDLWKPCIARAVIRLLSSHPDNRVHCNNSFPLRPRGVHNPQTRYAR